MMDYNEFVSQLRAEGEVESPGRFSVDPARRQQQLLQSTPPESVWEACALLRHGLFLAGQTPFQDGSHHNCIDSSRQYNFSKVSLADQPPPDQPPPGEGALTRSRVMSSFLRPFEAAAPVDLCLTRAQLWLSGRGFVIDWEFPEEEGLLVGPGSQTRPNSKKMKIRIGKQPLRLELRLPSKLEGDDQIWASQLPLRDIAAGFGRISRPRASRIDSLLNFSPFRSSETLIPFVSGWFQYRVSPCVLAERLVICEETPFALEVDAHPTEEVSLDHQNSAPIAELSSWRLWWERFGSSKEKSPALLRNWSPAAPPIDRRLSCKAVLVACATDAPSTVRLASWGPFLETVPLDCPPGLTAYVVWPELTDQVWGHRFVRDEHFEAAIEWTHQQVGELRAAMTRHFSYLAEGLLHFAARSYWKEVVSKVKQVWTLKEDS